jgi:hypothetical protein
MGVAGSSQGLGFAAAGLVSTVMACGLLLPVPGTVMSTDCNAAAPSRMPPAASTRRGSFGRSLWVTAEGVGVARLPTEPVTPNPAYLSRGLPPMLDLYFGPGACTRRRSRRLCLAALRGSATAFRHCCRIVTKSTAKCGAFDPRFFASWRCVIVAFEGVGHAYHRPCGGSRCIMCIGRVFSLPHQPSLFGTTGSSTIEVGFNRQTRARRG